MKLVIGIVRPEYANDVLLLAGKQDAATASFRQALDRYERKGHVVLAERMRERLAEYRGMRLVHLAVSVVGRTQ